MRRDNEYVAYLFCPVCYCVTKGQPKDGMCPNCRLAMVMTELGVKRSV